MSPVETSKEHAMPAALPAFAPEATARAAATGSVVRRRLRLTADDGFHLAADLFQGAAPARATVLIASAMGVPRRLYAGLAETLAAAGLTTLTLDYRGIGESRPPSLRRLRARLSDWAELDLAAAVRELRGRHPELPLLWLGHSVGGQLLGLLPDAPVHAALLIGSQSGHWRHWPGSRRWLMASLWWLAIPALVAARGYLPLSALGQGEDVPAGVARQWASWGRARDYIGSYARTRKATGFEHFRGRLRAIAISDDQFAPRPAVEALLALYRGAAVELASLSPHQVGLRQLGHFGFFRPRFRATLWADARDWLLSTLTPAT